MPNFACLCLAIGGEGVVGRAGRQSWVEGGEFGWGSFLPLLPQLLSWASLQPANTQEPPGAQLLEGVARIGLVILE